MSTVTRCARRAVRLVRGGEAALRALKIAAHRAERREARRAIRGGVEAVPRRRVTGHDVA